MNIHRTVIMGCLAVTLVACVSNQKQSLNPSLNQALKTTTADSSDMTDQKYISREWVEIREESKDGNLVFRPIDFPIAPARGRRHLKLSQAEMLESKDTEELTTIEQQGVGKTRGIGQGLEAGATDKLEAASSGDWSLDNKMLQISIPGWEGEYQIEKLQDDIMVLHKVEKTN